MNVLIVKTPKSKVIFYLNIFILMMMIIGGGMYYYYFKKVEPVKQIQVVKEEPMSNISFEINQIQNILKSENILDLKFQEKNIIIKVTKNADIEPIIARYEDMMEVFYEKNFNILKIRKAEIKKDDSKKEQLYDYLTTKGILEK